MGLVKFVVNQNRKFYMSKYFEKVIKVVCVSAAIILVFLIVNVIFNRAEPALAINSCSCLSQSACDTSFGTAYSESASACAVGMENCCYQGSCSCLNAGVCKTIGSAVVANTSSACSAGMVRCCYVTSESESPSEPPAGSNASKSGTAINQDDAKIVIDNYDGASCGVPGTSFSFPCPLGGGQEKLPQIFGRIIKWSLGLVGALFFAMFIYGGFMYIIAGANSKNAETGQKTLVNAVIGLTIVIFSYMIVTWLYETFSAGLG